VGAGFNPVVLRDMLRRDKGYSGLILSDWAITNDCPERCQAPSKAAPQDRDAIGMPWGVEALSKENRFARGVEAGIDQFGGTDDPAPLLAAVRTGKVTVKQVDAAVRHILLLKFRLGLFDHAFVDGPTAARIVGSAAYREAGEAAQEEAQVLLENRNRILPLAASRRVWLYGVDRAAAAAAGFVVVDRPEQADAAIVRVQAPFERLHPYNFFGSLQHEGRLDFRTDDPGLIAFNRASDVVPTVLAVDLDRPAVLSSLRDKAAALIGLFGASDLALLRVVSGAAMPKGRLPIELPSSMASVIAQHAARPNDSRLPLFPRGASVSGTWPVSPKGAAFRQFVDELAARTRN
jgi:beta-glucosidase